MWAWRAMTLDSHAPCMQTTGINSVMAFPLSGHVEGVRMSFAVAYRGK